MFYIYIKKNVNFNYKIIVNIIYQDKKTIFYLIDTIIAFLANKFLK